MARTPRARTSSATCSSSGRWRAVRATSAPASASARAITRPIPRLAPLTRAIFPLSWISIRNLAARECRAEHCGAAARLLPPAEGVPVDHLQRLDLVDSPDLAREAPARGIAIAVVVPPRQLVQMLVSPLLGDLDHLTLNPEIAQGLVRVGDLQGHQASLLHVEVLLAALAGVDDDMAALLIRLHPGHIL